MACLLVCALSSCYFTVCRTGLNTDFNDQWKVLIYDKDCRDIISPLLNVGDLRQKGVTLHLEVGSVTVFGVLTPPTKARNLFACL
jgi:hypothetical protein